MRDVIFSHRYTSTLRDKIRKKNPENHIVGFLKNLFANIYIYIYICVNIFVCVCVYIYIYIYVYIYVCVYICVCVCVCIYIYIYIYIYVYVFNFEGGGECSIQTPWSVQNCEYEWEYISDIFNS